MMNRRVQPNRRALLALPAAPALVPPAAHARLSRQARPPAFAGEQSQSCVRLIKEFGIQPE